MKIRAAGILAAVFCLLAVVSAFGFPAPDGGQTPDPLGDPALWTGDPAPYRTFDIFVGGDVEREGHYNAPVGITYGQLFLIAGFRDVFPYPLGDKVPPDTGFLISGVCVNINYALYEDLLWAAGGDRDIARAIADFVAGAGGAVEDKEDLLDKNILTDAQFEAVKNKIYALVQA